VNESDIIDSRMLVCGAPKQQRGKMNRLESEKVFLKRTLNCPRLTLCFNPQKSVL